MKVEEVLSCSFPSWYDKFKKCTIKSIVVPLTPEVLAYMQDNGTLVLPEGSQPEPTYKKNKEEEDEEGDDWDHCETSGCVVQDASWIALNNSLRCCTPGDVYLLLKSSNFVTHDLTAPFKVFVSEI
ncbi:hypothetical protein OTU49_005506 [Cherax quadricarinatus]|uniref:Cell division cycle protein 123 homolog n=1 Tax=Cherax quadricarinatus TaxID=27406 RepID=A0AAW0WW10_CHEQU